ncbi:hypothetical protein [Methanogenium cariaci]|uniref:NADH-quinone oxidoreductase subunit D-related protein n=1 Tax=Methanogenium cariaci TaxID=2197 RepID=UPI0024811ED9|nr:hypothetical protein [Methanogenium cariaci]
MTLFLEDTTIKLRCMNCGVLSERDALELCTVGPTARASGLALDVRTDAPYAAYGDIEVKPILPDVYADAIKGDVYDRIVVRLFEVVDSVRIIRDLMDQMPAGGRCSGRQNTRRSLPPAKRRRVRPSDGWRPPPW